MAQGQAFISESKILHLTMPFRIRIGAVSRCLLEGRKNLLILGHS